MERRLAAVMIADVAGYGRLSQVDEEGTRTRFQADLQDVLQPKIAEHHGRLIKTMGDAVLVEFHSVVDALRCAVDVQQKEAERNIGVPSGRRMDFRIGVNLGDIIVEGDDIHGDGVNIADRMQALAEPGGIAISGTAYDHVKMKLPLGFASLGQQKVKSIDDPVRVYRVLLDPVSAGRTIGAEGPPGRAFRPAIVVAAAVVLLLGIAAAVAWDPIQTAIRGEPTGPNTAALAATPSLVVLPFDNISDDKEQGFLADGITEDLTTELARIPGLFVVSRNAAFTYKGKAIQPSEVGQALGVRYILEGSIRRVGADLRINAQLIDVASSGHMWAERYDGAWSEVFHLQDQIVANIANALKLRLMSTQSGTQMVGGTSNAAAYEAYLRGMEAQWSDSPESQAKAVTYFKQSLELDPDFGRAAAELAWVYWNAWGVETRMAAMGVTEREAIDNSTAYLELAAKHPSASYYQLVSYRFTRRQRSDEAIEAMEKGMPLDPSDTVNYDIMSEALTLNGRAQEGLTYVDAATRINPNWTGWRRYLAGLALFSQERFEEAASMLNKIDEKRDGIWSNFFALILRASVDGHLDRLDDMAEVHRRLEPLLSDLNIDEFTSLAALSHFPYKNAADRERLLEGLKKAGVPSVPTRYAEMVENRLSGEEIRDLLYGHEIEGRKISPSESYWRSTSADGTTKAIVGGVSDVGEMTIESDTSCIFYPIWGRICFAYFRNPAGTREQRNEYLSAQPWAQFEFSIVK